MPLLHVVRGQDTRSTGLLGAGKKTFYTLNLTVELSQEERQLLEKYGHMNTVFEVVDKDVVASIIGLKEEWKGLVGYTTTITRLQTGMEWACTMLPTALTNIPLVVEETLVRWLSQCIAREEWGGEETRDFGVG
jgi:hypothetical protein